MAAATSEAHDREAADVSGTSPPGLPLERLAPWLRSAVPGEAGELSAEIITGGRSNLTYLVSDGASRWVVRRPPLGHVLPTAHDMVREFRILTWLGPTEVPVPSALALCEDVAVLGAPFYVMEFVPGSTFRHASELEPLGPERTRQISIELIDTLATIHSVDLTEAVVGDPNKADGFLARQVRLWDKQMAASRTRDLPVAAELHAQLQAKCPTQSVVGLVHGDYRLDNLLIADDGRAAAVVDWEMATLGDPVTDLALMMVYHQLGEHSGGGPIANANCAPGFLTPDEIVARYEERSGRRLRDLGFNLGLASFKLAAILEGIHYRYLRGETVGAGFDQLGDLVEPLLDSGLTAMAQKAS